ncbi:MAG: peptidoglycan DD-metalloendopeptidase family protein [Anaerolineales bacterium]|nr:peptidoglycan DD-metalloendopeptidase family protein [Anaerolineales bacterium]
MANSVPALQPEEEVPSYRNWRFWAGSFAALVLVSAVGFWAWNAFHARPSGLPGETSVAAPGTPTAVVDPGAELPSVPGSSAAFTLYRTVDPHTDIPERGSAWVTEYVVQRGDNLSTIASKFGLQWQTIMFGNTDTLKDDPNFLKPGQTLYILPVDGAFYKWKEKDTLESVSAQFHVEVEAIVDWPGNELNPLDPVVRPGTWVIIPGGWRPFSWEVAPVSTGGTSRTYSLGPGTCAGKYNGTPGTGDWIWPTANHNLSGYDFGPAHPGIDIYVYIGQPIYASQAGVIVFTGWSDRGYGYLVIVDHLNQWHTFYAHLDYPAVQCGQQVWAGSLVGYGGTTGNSTGPHLHYEMRFNGVGQNPWGLLPPP